MLKPLKALAIIMTLLATTIPAIGDDSYVVRDPRAYVFEKLARHDIVFLGTTHKQPAILDFIADLLPGLHAAGVTHIAVEVTRDQQGRIDRYLGSGCGLADIEIYRSIDCPKYRHLFDIIRKIDADKRPEVAAIDLPLQGYDSPVNRDAYMASSLEKIFASRPDAKVLAILGTFHVLRQLNWNKRALDGHVAIRTLLGQRYPQLSMFSIAHILSRGEHNCDFSRHLGPVPGMVAMDVSPLFDQWQLGLFASLAIKPAPTGDLLDGVIVY